MPILLNKRNAKEVAFIEAWFHSRFDEQVEYAKRSADILLRSATGGQLIAVKRELERIGLPTEPKFL